MSNPVPEENEIRRWVGEIIFAGFNSLTVNDHARQLIEHHHVRNIILFTRNVQSLPQVRRLTEDLQALAAASESAPGDDTPLLICTDQENGIVRRLAADVPGLPGNMAVGATFDAKLAEQIGVMTARQLLAAGINMNLAPVLDVNNNPNNPVIGIRSYGEDPASVAELGVAMVRGLQSQGVVACGKHFPGHGDTAVDSHLDLPAIAHDRDRLNEVELRPFREAIAAGIDTIMTAHVVFPAVEPSRIPATISKAVLTDLLRRELGFEGVITTDCLEMNAISETIGVGKGAVQALNAGADMVMVSHRLDRQEAAINAIVHAVQTGELPLSRLQDAVHRVRSLRQRRLSHNGAPSSAKSAGTPPSVSEGAAATHVMEDAIRLQVEASRRAVTVVADDEHRLPLDPRGIRRVVILLDPAVPKMVAAESSEAANALQLGVKRALPSATVTVLPNSFGASGAAAGPSNTPSNQLSDPSSHSLPNAMSGALANPLANPDIRGADLILIGLYGATDPAFLAYVQALNDAQLPVVVIALQAPYRLAALRKLHTALAIYEPTPWMMAAALGVVLHGGATGRLPVSIQPGMERGHGLVVPAAVR